MNNKEICKDCFHYEACFNNKETGWEYCNRFVGKDEINRQKEELEILRTYICDNDLHWDLLSYCNKNEIRKKKKEECKYCINEICVNADCPMRADYCPVYDTPGVCKYEKRVSEDK